ncbi:hypothetical protein VOLCADRAFT_90288 [Volvox carteri f. nagariensis]|uniref:Uncharacterized protein n=1 Tax=Volvox carteri f. nagariensis TaxID=3068 RepID=D8TTZ3_VOLCA|nr:uncharacterized protein VOLCADRAFT_90288 [Volvox carteri f. nagariensis]EFJ48950.1 hypothetical protein VOLCADRAFT_90288 [Volvox carteri f. nagariensis]|eukprot:XP_002949847.1 hypothetical protein VOLCADRAFT_90288 [Volvox carteri f. nagariensis]
MPWYYLPSVHLPFLALLLSLMLACSTQETDKKAQPAPPTTIITAEGSSDQVLALPAPPADGEGGASVPTLTVGGGKVALDALGPAIGLRHGVPDAWAAHVLIGLHMVPFIAARVVSAHVWSLTDVAEDGTLRRIANWATLSEHERQVALRRIGQRNQVDGNGKASYNATWGQKGRLRMLDAACCPELKAIVWRIAWG